MRAALLMTIAWPAFLAACGLQLLVFAFVDPLELQWAGQPLAWSRQAVYTGAFFLFWAAAAVSSALTALLGLRSTKPQANGVPGPPAGEREPRG